MKAITSYLLLIVFLFNILGYVVVFKISQIQIKKEVKRELKSKIKRSELHLISVNQNDFDQINWVEEGKEFILNNKMYDIVKRETSGNTILIYCIDDKQEKALFANLEDHISRHISDNKSSSKREIKINDTPIKYFQTWTFSTALRFPKNIIHSSQKLFSIQEFNIGPNTPPPRFL